MNESARPDDETTTGNDDEGWVWPSEAEAGLITVEDEAGLFAEAMELIEERKPNRAQRRAQARKYMGRETRQQLHGFGRWRKHRSR